MSQHEGTLYLVNTGATCFRVIVINSVITHASYDLRGWHNRRWSELVAYCQRNGWAITPDPCSVD